jgi:hypothetical protein
MREIWPAYADSVAFYAIGVDPSEDIEELEADRGEQGYPWPVARSGPGMLAAYKVITQSTKVAFDSNGVIRYRDGYGGGGEETWRSVFEELSATR